MSISAVMAFQQIDVPGYYGATELHQTEKMHDTQAWKWQRIGTVSRDFTDWLHSVIWINYSSLQLNYNFKAFSNKVL